MNYKVTVHRTDEGFSVSVPALPGCSSAGATEDEALANIEAAIREYLATLGDRKKALGNVADVEAEERDRA